MASVTSNLQSSSSQNPDLIKDIQHFSRYRPMLSSVMFSTLSALFVPLAMLFLVWQLSPAYDLNSLRGAVCQGLKDLAPIVLISMMLKALVSSKGPAHQHFGWDEGFCLGLHTMMWTFVCVSLPCRFFAVALNTFQEGAWSDSLGRMFFIGSIVALTTGLLLGSHIINKSWDQNLSRRGLRVGRAERRRSNESLLSGGPVDVATLTAAEPWTAFPRRLALTLLPLVLLTLCFMSATGYHFTAFEMSTRAIWSALAVFGLANIAAFISRVLLTAQFRIKLRQLDLNEEGQIDKDESINIGEISSQVNRLVNVTALMGMIVVAWQIWSAVSPTISYLDSIELWKSTRVDALGKPDLITPRDVLMGIGVLAMTFVLSRNLPGLLEITLLERLPLDKGGRYAISFVVRYMCGIFGILFAVHLVGFSWSSVQWLAAGLTVGLGFGLQEIFANLISGIIILIERPVRVGDFVSVNGITGTVSRMELRATTIRDLDHRELIVPNKKFITDDVMNWTLSDSLYRTIISVGVAYGSDTKLVEDTLLEVARRHPQVRRDPAPEVVFKAFGESTLDFELRVVLPDRDRLPKIQHDLNMAIDQSFRQKNIEIAFPQREIRVRTAEEIIPTAGATGSETLPKAA